MASNYTDIFTLAEEEEKLNLESNHNIQNFTPSDKNFERTVVFVGEKGAGKTSLINALKGVQKDEPTKPTYAIDYSFAKRNTNTRKEVVHFYEVGGGRDSTNLITTPITKENYRYISYVIVVDLSRPSTIVESLNFWMSAIRESVAHFVKRNSDIPNEDREYVRNFCEVGDNEDREPRKWIARMMRYYSHINGCSLYYFSVMNQKLMAQTRTLLNNYFFGTHLPNLMQKDYQKPLFITFGSDTIESMGIPIKESLSANDIFNKINKDYFPPEKDDTKQSKASYYEPSKYPESKIDSTKLEKEANKNESPSSYNNLDRQISGEMSQFTRPDSSSRSSFLDVEANKPKGEAPIKRMRPKNPVLLNQGPN